MFKAFLCVLMMSQVVFADTFYVDSVSGEAGGLGETVKELVKSEVSSQGHQTVSDQTMGQWVLSPKLLKLGGSYIMTLSKSKNGVVVSSQKLKAASEGELDTVSEQLVRSVLGNKSIGASEKLDLNNKQEVSRQLYFGFGPGFLSGLDNDKSGIAWAVGYLWGLDPRFALRVNVEGLHATDGDADNLMTGLGGQYYLTDLKHSPYVLGLLGYSWSDAEEKRASCLTCNGDSEHGWAGEIGVGMHFFRNTTVNIAAELTYTAGFYKINDQAPGATSLKLVVLW